MEKVGVVVLTCNRRKLLEITLCKVMAQTFRNFEILVVDNNSKDGTEEFLKEKNMNVLSLKENMGPAGGFYEGIKFFAENRTVDFVWLMDDDFFPFDSCLEILLKATDKNSVVFPYVREKDFALRLQPGWWGVLVPMDIIKQVGYPRKDLFFWSEDTEYLQHRIRDIFNFPSKWIPAAKGVHFTKRERNFRPPWRYYYEIRNTIYSRLYIRKRTWLRLFKLVRSWIKLFGAILLKEEGKREKLKWFFKGTFDGISKKLGRTIDPQQLK